MKDKNTTPVQQTTPVIESNTNKRFNHSDQYYGRFLFDTLSSAVLYLDQWGRIRSANNIANQLFESEHLAGKTALEVLCCWDNPIHTHKEILNVARTGHSIKGLIEKVVINNEERWFQTDKIAVENTGHGFNGVVFTLDDITEIKQQQLRLAKSEASYRAFVENSHDAIWRIDLNLPLHLSKETTDECYIEHLLNNAVIGDCNHIFNSVYGGCDSQRLNGVSLKSIQNHNSIIDLSTFVGNQFQIHGKNTRHELVDGSYQYLKISAQGIFDNGYLLGIWGVARDITESRKYVERLEYQNTHDTLTGLPNRVLLQQTMETLIEEHKSDNPIALMIIDLDGFKDINDTLGHSIGDNIIQQLANRLQQKLKNTPAFVARLGGDEFAIVLPDIEYTERVFEVGQMLLSCIRQYFYIDEIEVETRASIGISLYPDQANDFSTLLRYADVAMYCAKKDLSGVALYSTENDPHSPQRLSLMSELGKAIREDQLSLYFQPKVCVHSRQVVGVEALLRWFHPTMGFISPADFIPIAEVTDLINDLTRWVVNESLRQVNIWRKHSLDLSVAVNISARNLQQDDFCDMIKSLLLYYDLPASCLELEITESTIMKDMDKTLLILKELNDIGVELSIDDFGTGYSSLAYLKRLPVQRLKIDYSFIINMLDDEQDQVIVNSTINMAHNLGLLVVAEGVENQEVLQQLGDMKCEQAQGYHIARPMPGTDVEQWCANYG